MCVLPRCVVLVRCCHLPKGCNLLAPTSQPQPTQDTVDQDEGESLPESDNVLQTVRADAHVGGEPAGIRFYRVWR